MSNKETFFIIGAGISGLVLSLLMSRSGYRDALYDKRKIYLTIIWHGFLLVNGSMS